MPRSRSRSVVGTSQSQTCQVMMRLPARAICRGRSGVPPHMIGVERDAEAVAKLVTEIGGVRQRIHAGAVGGIHRMQGLKRERYAGVVRVGQQRSKAVANLRMRTGEILRSFRQAAADQHQALRADAGGLIDGTLVVVERGAAAGLVRGGKQSGPAQARDGDAGVAHDPTGLRNADRLHEIAPRRDGGDASARAARRPAAAATMP